MPADPRENPSPADGAKAKVGELSAGVRNALRELDVTVAPIAGAIASVAITVSAAASLYSEARRRKKSEGGSLATATSLVHTAEPHVLNR